MTTRSDAAFWDGAAWLGPQRVSDDDTRMEDHDTQPRLAVGPQGEAWIVWVGHQSLYDTEVYASYWDGGHWSAEVQVNSDDGTPDISPSLAVDDLGRPWVAWQGWAATPTGPQSRIYASQGDVQSGWSPEERVSSDLATNVFEGQVALALDANRNPHLLWSVTGRPSGLGYTSYNGTRWLPPSWAVQGTRADYSFLLFEQVPQAYWLEAAPSPEMSLRRHLLPGTPGPLTQAPALPAPESVIINRHLAFGDSITWGQFQDPPGTPVGAYPARLEERLDTRVVASEVINRGEPGERTGSGMFRLKEEELPAYDPNFVEIMEGTNDVTHLVPYNQVAFNLLLMVGDSKAAGAKPLLATLIPRRDSLNDETLVQNGYIAGVASGEHIPLVDTWAAFYAYGQWQDLMLDVLHPNALGMQRLTDTFYSVILGSFSWLYEETEPPTTWISSLLAETPCGQEGAVNWTGTDNLSWVVDYDVQMQLNGGAWTDWLMATTGTSASFGGYVYGDGLGFRVRGRDVVGNQSGYSAAQYTTVVDDTPPYDVQVGALSAVLQPPFQVRWWAADACSAVTRYDVEYRVGAGAWLPWLTGVSATSATFGDDETVQFGETYTFRVRAYDAANHWAESAPVSTLLAQYVLSGHTFNVRHEPVIRPQAGLTPTVLAIQPIPAGYTAYVAGAGVYDVSVTRAGFGLLPSMRAVSVAADVDGLDFVLPPLDDVVADGGFEAVGWGNWEPGGIVAPTLIAGGHTGDGAALLGGPGGLSWLSQPLSVPVSLDDGTLSFLARLDDGQAGSSTLRVELAGTPISHTQVVSSSDWTHVWLAVDEAVGQAVTLTFTLSGTPAIRLDEVSLGSAQAGGSMVYLPVISK